MRAHLSVLLNAGWGIGTDTFWLDNVFLPDDPWIGADAEHELGGYVQ